MPTSTLKLGLLFTCFASVLISCEAFHSPKPVAPVAAERKTLQRPTLAPDAVVFDVLLAHVPFQERDLAREFWNDVDELELDPEVRSRLNKQGFRVGLIGASPPESLSKLLALKGRELRESIEEEVDYSKSEASSVPVVFSKPVNLRVGMKSQIETGDEVLSSIPILENENGRLVGKSYTDARPILSVAIEQVPDGSVRFDVSPILKYGTPQPVTRYQHGQLVRTQEQPTKSFDNLKFSVALRPGQFLVVGATDSKTSALGRYFFTDGNDDFDQKFLVVRLLVTQHDGQFDRFADFKTLAHGDDADDADDATSDALEKDAVFNGFDDYRFELDDAPIESDAAETNAGSNGEPNAVEATDKSL